MFPFYVGHFTPVAPVALDANRMMIDLAPDARGSPQLSFANGRHENRPDLSLIVFSHANSFAASTYGVLFKSLRARGFTVRAVERFGHDPRYPVTDNWPHLVQQLHDFAQREVEKAGEPAWLVGHSLGGFLSLMCAARHPALASGVLLLDSPLLGGWKAHALGAIKMTQLVGSISPGAVSHKRKNRWASQGAGPRALSPQEGLQPLGPAGAARLRCARHARRGRPAGAQFRP